MKWIAGQRLLMLLALMLGICAARAGEAPPLASDPVLEARVMALAQELRCLVCQNETIAASQADLAQDLRRQIRQQLAAGRTPQQVKDYMVDRYGEFVLYRPRFEPHTWLLWLGPFVLLLLGAWPLLRRLRVRAQPADADAAEAAPLSALDARRARELLREGAP
ncbi:MAG: cytochrome c-type biogenesis protein CcmH [Proteobacteria bacterium]|nr:cytochrome c-type biogenesis protein CcmH [Pseudomonadota bacterium]